MYLNEDIIIHVFKFLDPIESRKASLTCKLWYCASQYYLKHEIWENMYENKIKFNQNKMIKFIEEGKRFITYHSKVKLLINVVIKSDNKSMQFMTLDGVIDSPNNLNQLYILVKSKQKYEKRALKPSIYG
jgi:hypothetical protein